MTGHGAPRGDDRRAGEGHFERVRQTTCLEPIWDGPYRMRCGMGTAGVCHRHGPHRPHPDDGRPCETTRGDGYCGTHGVYLPRATS